MIRSSTPILVVIFLSLLALSCGKVEEPEFRRLEKFGVRSMGLEEATIGFSVIYYNPNQFGVTVKDGSFNVSINNIHLGQFNQPSATPVNEKAEFSIPMEGKVSFQQAMQLDIPRLVGKEVLVKATGKVKIGKAGVFVTKDVNYEGRQVIDASLLSVN